MEWLPMKPDPPVTRTVLIVATSNCLARSEDGPPLGKADVYAARREPRTSGDRDNPCSVRCCKPQFPM